MIYTLESLRLAAEAGTVHTVRVSFSDRLGNWRGKRVPVQYFLGSTAGPDGSPMGVCDGMLVADVVCDVIQETPFTNYDTGYPDAHLWYAGRDIRPVGWDPGEVFVFGRALTPGHAPEGVHPPNVLERVVRRLAERGVSVQVAATLSGRIMSGPREPVALDQWPDGSTWGVLGRALDGLDQSGVEVAGLAAGRDRGLFSVALRAGEPMRVAEDLVVTKNALKELVASSGATATFMTLPPGGRQAASLVISLQFVGPLAADARVAAPTLDQARPLLQPSANAYKLGRHGPLRAEAGTGGSLGEVIASAEADPFTVVAVAIAALAHSAGSGEPTSCAAGSTGYIGLDARALGDAAWLSEWLGDAFIDNSIPLLAREGELLAAAVTDLEVDRYWATA
jgi:glutamine synthetase